MTIMLSDVAVLAACCPERRLVQLLPQRTFLKLVPKEPFNHLFLLRTRGDAGARSSGHRVKVKEHRTSGPPSYHRAPVR